MSKPVQNEVSSPIKENRLRSMGMLWQGKVYIYVYLIMVLLHYGTGILHSAEIAFELVLPR